jgi:hypothetical protein
LFHKCPQFIHCSRLQGSMFKVHTPNMFQTEKRVIIQCDITQPATT